jgi:hypothetical protein
MDEFYVFAVISAVGDPPNGNKMGVVRGDYVFMPFGGSQIFTIDEDIWKAAGGNTELVFFPDNSECNAIFQKALESDAVVLVGLVGECKLDVPGRGFTDLEFLQIGDKYRAVDAGYDVTDSFGLSAISNVGYSKDDIATITDLGISVNKYGLIHSENDSIRFAEFADRHVEEHAPFYPIKIKIIQRGKLG